MPGGTPGWDGVGRRFSESPVTVSSTVCTTLERRSCYRRGCSDRIVSEKLTAHNCAG